MTVTAQLLQLFRVDQQVRGLRSRLDQAERFLDQQTKLLAELDGKAATLEAQARQLRAQASNNEGEANRLDQKIANLREQMNSAKTAKEYNAFLTELGNYKDEKSGIETQVLEAMTKIEAFDRDLATLRAQQGERQKIVAGAKADRDTRSAEIKDRLEELTGQRRELAAALPKDVLAVFEGLVRTKGDDAMAHVEVIDRRNLEYSCAACMMTLPIETVSAVSSGKFTRCVSCGCVLFTEEELVAPKKPAKASRGA